MAILTPAGMSYPQMLTGWLERRAIRSGSGVLRRMTIMCIRKREGVFEKITFFDKHAQKFHFLDRF